MLQNRNQQPSQYQNKAIALGHTKKHNLEFCSTKEGKKNTIN